MSYFFFINKAFDQYPCRRSKSKYIDCLNFVLFCFNPTSLLHIVFCISNVLFMSVNIHSLSISLPLSPSIHQPHTNSSYGGGAYLMGKLLCVVAVVAIYICARVCVCACMCERMYMFMSVFTWLCFVYFEDKNQYLRKPVVVFLLTYSIQK